MHKISDQNSFKSSVLEHKLIFSFFHQNYIIFEHINNATLVVRQLRDTYTHTHTLHDGLSHSFRLLNSLLRQWSTRGHDTRHLFKERHNEIELKITWLQKLNLTTRPRLLQICVCMREGGQTDRQAEARI